MIARSLVALALALPLSSCAAPAAAPPGRPYAAIATDRGTVFVRVEIADTDQARARGLSGREALAADAGMVFLWQEDADVAFHMKDTRIPLSVAFFAADGLILRILDLAPCAAEPCPVYAPGVRYRGALEVNRGAFGRWQVREGHRINVER